MSVLTQGQTFICTTADIDEAQQTARPSTIEPMTARDLCLSLWDIVESGKTVLKSVMRFSDQGGVGTLNDLRSLLMYAVEMPTRRRRTPMDVEAMVARWVPIIRGLATAHDKATVDQCEYQEEAHLQPLLAAPVKQIREFYAKLTQALKDDPTIPFFVWQMFEAWGEVVLKKAPDGDIKELKSELAEEIARMADEHVRVDLPKAIAGALQWRSPETLERMRDELKGGKKAKMVGRSSCLFLEIGSERVML